MQRADLRRIKSQNSFSVVPYLENIAERLHDIIRDNQFHKLFVPGQNRIVKTFPVDDGLKGKPVVKRLLFASDNPQKQTQISFEITRKQIIEKERDPLIRLKCLRPFLRLPHGNRGAHTCIAPKLVFHMRSLVVHRNPVKLPEQNRRHLIDSGSEDYRRQRIGTARQPRDQSFAAEIKIIGTCAERYALRNAVGRQITIINLHHQGAQTAAVNGKIPFILELETVVAARQRPAPSSFCASKSSFFRFSFQSSQRFPRPFSA